MDPLTPEDQHALDMQDGDSLMAVIAENAAHLLAQGGLTPEAERRVAIIEAAAARIQAQD